MTNPFAPNQRAAKLAQMLPTWASRAACAEKAPNQAPFGPFFDDEVAQRPDPDTYRWPANVTKALRLCAGCPVRPQCLDYVMRAENTEEINLGFVMFRSRHREDCDWMAWDADEHGWWEHKPPMCHGCGDRVFPQEFTLVQARRFGTLGGTPGRVREHYSNLCTCFHPKRSHDGDWNGVRCLTLGCHCNAFTKRSTAEVAEDCVRWFERWRAVDAVASRADLDDRPTMTA